MRLELQPQPCYHTSAPKQDRLNRRSKINHDLRQTQAEIAEYCKIATQKEHMPDGPGIYSILAPSLYFATSKLAE